MIDKFSKSYNRIIENKDIKKRIVFLVVLFSFVGIFIWMGLTNLNQEGVNALKGNFSLRAGEVQRLNGEWLFVWNKLVESEEFQNRSYQDIVDSNVEAEFVKVPSMWNYYENVFWKDGKGKGFGTFALEIKGLIPGEEYAIRFPSFGTAAKVYIDNKLIYEVGKVHIDKEISKGKYKVSYKDFTALDENASLVIQISNHDYARGGIWLPLLIGSKADIEAKRVFNIGLEHFILGAICIMIIFALVLSFYLKEYFGLFYFIIIAFLIILYLITSGEKLIVNWFPGISLDTIVRIQYLIMFVAPMTFLNFLHDFLSWKVFKRTIKIWNIFGVIFGLLAIFLPLYTLTKMAYFGNFIIYLSIFQFMLTLIIALLKGSTNAMILIVSSSFMAITIIHDFLFVSTVVSSNLGELINIGFMIMMISMSVVIAFSLSKIYKRTLKLSLLEQAYFNAQIKPHFLFNTLNTIAELIVIDPEKSEELIFFLSTYLRHILSFDNLNRKIPIKHELELVKAYIEIQKARFPKIQVFLEVEDKIDFSLPPMSIQPLVENAIGHGLRMKRSEGIVRVKIFKENEKIFVYVEDNGSGIEGAKIKKLYKMISLYDMLEEEEHPISTGLYNINYRLIHAGFTPLQIESEIDKGTRVSFSTEL